MGKHGGYSDLPILAELYDHVPGYTNRPDIDFYRSICGSVHGDILELACGTGRILLPVARDGCRITGLDASENMLAQCHGKLESEPAEVRNRVQLVNGDMTDFNLNTRFELIYVPFRSFQHVIKVEDQLSCLRCVHKHLAPKGTFILDIFHVDHSFIVNVSDGREIEDTPELELPDGRKMRRAHRVTAVHPGEQYNEVELIYYVTDSEGNTVRIVQAFPMRHFYRYEVQHLFARTGFAISELYGDYDKSPLNDDSPEMLFIAKKIE